MPPRLLALSLLLALLPALAWAQYAGPAHPAPMPLWQYELTQKLWPYSIAVLLGFAAGSFYSEKARPFRLFLMLGGLALTVLNNTLLGCIILFFAGMRLALRWLRHARRPEAPPTTFGSAQWATLAHLQANGLTGTTGLRLGELPHGNRSYPLHYTGNRHLLTVAPTRSGKGVSAIIPNLLTYPGSAVIIDPKGENAIITAPRRMAMGQDVHVIDPWGITPFPASCFNPLDWLHASGEDISENAMMLADSLITRQEGASDPFWNEEAKALLMGLLLYVALDSDEASRTLGRVRDIITSGEQGLMETLRSMVTHENPIIASTAQRTAGKDPKLLSNVLATLQSHTHFLDSPRMRESLSRSDLQFQDLKVRPMTVYLVLPADRLDTFGRWLRLIIQQAITVNARNIGVLPDRPILFMLDEMAALGRLQMVEQAYGLMAGFGMQLWGIVQDLGQLERIYGHSWETFIGNSGVIQYFGSRDLKTAEYFSKLCGVATLRKFSWSRAIGKSIGTSWGRSYSDSGAPGQSGGGSNYGGNEGSSDTTTTSADTVQRHLAFADELMVLRDDKQLLFIESFNPIQGRKVRWYEDKDLRALGVNLEQKALPETMPQALPTQRGVGLPRVLAERKG